MTTNGTTTVQNTTTALARHEATGIGPSNMGELQALAASAAKSGFYGAKSQEQALMILMAGSSLGLDYSQSLRAFHVIEMDGRPPKLTLSADAMVAVCLDHADKCEYFRIIESDDKHAIVEAKRRGDEPRRSSFSVEDAQRANLVKAGGNWTKYPARMCLARAKAFLARDLFPDLLLGLYDPDEIRDSVEAERRPRSVTVSPVRVVPAVAPNVTPDGEVIEDVQTAPAANGLIAAVHAADSAEALERLGAEIASANLNDDERKALRAEYSAKKKALKGAV